MGEKGGVLAFLMLVGSFFGFMFVLAFLTARARAPRSERDYGWPIETDERVAFLDVLLRLVWVVVIVSALMTWPLAALTLVVASIPLVLGYQLSPPEILRNLLTAELIYGIVIAASLVVAIALFMSLLVGELISDRKSRLLDESQLVRARESRARHRHR